MKPFRNRADAGARLAAELACRDWADPVVFGLARGGLPVAAPVARELDAPVERRHRSPARTRAIGPCVVGAAGTLRLCTTFRRGLAVWPTTTCCGAGG